MIVMGDVHCNPGSLGQPPASWLLCVCVQAAAGMGIYGPRTVFCLAVKGYPGCHEFLLMDDGKWVHVKETTGVWRVREGSSWDCTLCAAVLCRNSHKFAQVAGSRHIQAESCLHACVVGPGNEFWFIAHQSYCLG